MRERLERGRQLVSAPRHVRRPLVDLERGVRGDRRAGLGDEAPIDTHAPGHDERLGATTRLHEPPLAEQLIESRHAAIVGHACPSRRPSPQRHQFRHDRTTPSTARPPELARLPSRTTGLARPRMRGRTYRAWRGQAGPDPRWPDLAPTWRMARQSGQPCGKRARRRVAEECVQTSARNFEQQRKAAWLRQLPPWGQAPPPGVRPRLAGSDPVRQAARSSGQRSRVATRLTSASSGACASGGRAARRARAVCSLSAARVAGAGDAQLAREGAAAAAGVRAG